MTKQFGLLLWFFGFMLWLNNQAHAKVTLSPYDFETQKTVFRDKSQDAYKLEELVFYSFKNAYDAQLGALHVTQLRKTVNAQLGDLLPHLNLAGMVNFSGAAPLEILSSLVGFLFPNRWKTMLAAQKLRDAEKENLKATLADRTNITIEIYYEIQNQIYQLRVLDFYIQLTHNIMEELKLQSSEKLRMVPHIDLGLLRVLSSKLRSQRATLDNLAASYPQLAQSVGFPISPIWKDFPVEATPFQKLPLKEAQHEDFWTKATEQSPELKSLALQIEAAKHQITATQLAFLDPQTDPKLGLGYGFLKYVELAKLQVKILQVQSKQTHARIFTQIANALNNHNDAISQFPHLLDARAGMKETFIDLEYHINTQAEPLDIVKVVQSLEFGFTTDMDTCKSMFSYLTAKANLERYTWEGVYYETLKKFIEHDESFVKKGNLSHLKKTVVKMNAFFKKKTGAIRNPDYTLLESPDMESSTSPK